MKILALLTFVYILLSANGETIYKQKCASCHKQYISMAELKENFVDFANKKLNLKAPTLNQLSFRLKREIGDMDGDKDFHKMEVVEFIKDYSIEPKAQKSLCASSVKKAFRTMPSMKGKINEEDLEEVAIYIYDFEGMYANDNSDSYVDLTETFKQAKKENKLVLIKATSAYCHFCKIMEREVFSEKDVKDILKKDYVVKEVDVFKKDLPPYLKYRVTPTLFFLDSDKKILKKISGSLKKSDFLTLSKEAKIKRKGEKK
jgi:thioredoxin-related protein